MQEEPLELGGQSKTAGFVPEPWGAQLPRTHSGLKAGSCSRAYRVLFFSLQGGVGSTYSMRSLGKKGGEKSVRRKTISYC